MNFPIFWKSGSQTLSYTLILNLCFTQRETHLCNILCAHLRFFVLQQPISPNSLICLSMLFDICMRMNVYTGTAKVLQNDKLQNLCSLTDSVLTDKAGTTSDKSRTVN